MILVLGSINIDLVFALPNLPRQGETVLGADYLVAPGGKGANQAVAAARDGARVTFHGCVGDDAFGRIAYDALAAAAIDVRLLRDAARPTACAAVCVDAGGHNQIAVASGANLAVRAAQIPDAALGDGTTLILQMEIPRLEIESTIARAKRYGSRVVLNLAPALPLADTALAAVDVLVVNEHEAASLAGTRGITAAEPAALAAGLAATLGNIVVVTLGGEGAVAARRGETWRVGALPIAPVDTTGAGDAFVGVLAAALDRGAALPDALRRAGVASGLSCLAKGAMPAMPGTAAIDARLPELAPARLVAA